MGEPVPRLTRTWTLRRFQRWQARWIQASSIWARVGNSARLMAWARAMTGSAQIQISKLRNKIWKETMVTRIRKLSWTAAFAALWLISQAPDCLKLTCYHDSRQLSRYSSTLSSITRQRLSLLISFHQRTRLLFSVTIEAKLQTVKKTRKTNHLSRQVHKSTRRY